MQTIAELVNDRKIDGIADLHDEFGREEKVRIVIELKANARPHTVLNNLYKHTQLQMTFGALMLAIVDGRPQVLSLKAMLGHYITHRRNVVTRRTQHELTTARERAHILEGLTIVLDNLDETIALIRGRAGREARRRPASEQRFGLTERQSKAIVDLRLGRLTRLESGKLREEYEELIKKIAQLEDLLANPRLIDGVIKDEVTNLRRRFADPAAQRDPPRRARDERGRPHPAGAGLRDADASRLHQAHVTRHLPRATSRRQGRGRGAPLDRRGLHRALDDREHAQRHAVLHQPWPRLPPAHPRDSGRQAPGQGHPDHQPDRGRPGREGHRAHRHGSLQRRAVPGDGHQARPDQEDARRLRTPRCAATG